MLADLEPYERRLYKEQAIPVTDRSGAVSAGDRRWNRWEFWDVDVPPEDWLTRHKNRDPRR